MKARQVARLAQLAELRARRSGQVLARAQAAIAGLEAQAEALRAPLPAAEDVASCIARDRHAAWRTQQLVRLNQEIASRRAHAEPLRRAHGRDRARAEVVEALTDRGVRR